MEDKLLDERTVAKRLGCSVQLLRKWRRQKKGPRFVIVGGKLVRYRESDVDEFIASLPSPSVETNEGGTVEKVST